MLPENIRFSSSSCKEEPTIANLHFKPRNICQSEEHPSIKPQSTQCCQLVFKLIHDRWAEFVSSQCLHRNRHVTAPPGHSGCSVLKSISPKCWKETLIDRAPILSPLWRCALYQQGCRRPQPRACAEREETNRGSPAFHSHHRGRRDHVAVATAQLCNGHPGACGLAEQAYSGHESQQALESSYHRSLHLFSFSSGYATCHFSFHQKKNPVIMQITILYFFEVATLKCTLVDANTSANRQKFNHQPWRRRTTSSTPDHHFILWSHFYGCINNYIKNEWLLLYQWF